MLKIGSLTRKLIPRFAYSRIRAARGDYQYQERLGKLTPPWTAYGLLMAVRYAKKHGISSISDAEFGVANGRGLRRMTNLAERLSAQSHVKIIKEPEGRIPQFNAFGTTAFSQIPV